MDITKRTQEFDMTKGEIGYIYGSLSSSNYAENLKTNYIDAKLDILIAENEKLIARLEEYERRLQSLEEKK